MPFAGEPFKALLTDVVTPRYAFTLMESTRCGSPTDKDFLVLTMGTGTKQAVVVTGFTVNDYKITNALLYMVLSKCVNDVYPIPTLSATQLSRWTIRFVPMANPWPFNSWDVIRGRELFYELDGDGIPVRYDALTLRSRYSVMLHNLVNDVKPDLVIMLLTSNRWSIMTPETIKVDDYETTVSDPTDFLHHFSYEGYPTLIVSVPSEAGFREIAHGLIQLIKDHNVTRQRAKPLELVIRVNGDVNNVANILRFHGLLVGIDGNKLIIRASDRSQQLLNALIDNNLIENYFNVEILEVHLQ